jgi:dihydrofolate reductase
MRVAIIVAMDRGGLIGADGTLPWRLPADLQRFKAITMGHPLIMGRKTHESIGRPLPGRLNIVLSRQVDYHAEGCVVVPSMNEALRAGADAEQVFVIGGADIYRAALPGADTIYLTRVDADFDGDTRFPEWDEEAWRVVSRERHSADDRNRYPYEFRVLERRRLNYSS